MVKVKFNVTCMATYVSELSIPKNIVNNKEDVLNYIREHLSECNTQELEWLNDLEPSEAVTAEDIRCIEYAEEVRATNIIWDAPEQVELPTTVIIPERLICSSDTGDISEWLSEQYGFCHKGFELVKLTGEELEAECEQLKRAVHNAGVDAIEEFLGHSLDNDTIDIWAEMNDCIAQMPDEAYFEYLSKYCG